MLSRIWRLVLILEGAGGLLLRDSVEVDGADARASRSSGLGLELLAFGEFGIWNKSALLLQLLLFLFFGLLLFVIRCQITLRSQKVDRVQLLVRQPLNIDAKLLRHLLLPLNRQVLRRLVNLGLKAHSILEVFQLFFFLLVNLSLVEL